MKIRSLAYLIVNRVSLAILSCERGVILEYSIEKICRITHAHAYTYMHVFQTSSYSLVSHDDVRTRWRLNIRRFLWNWTLILENINLKINSIVSSVLFYSYVRTLLNLKHALLTGMSMCAYTRGWNKIHSNINTLCLHRELPRARVRALASSLSHN